MKTLRAIRHAGLCAAAVAAILLTGCASSTKSSGPEKPLSQLSWCVGQQSSTEFLDVSTPNPTPTTSWAAAKPQLGFTVYLPPTLPKDACLAAASGTFHDPQFNNGGQMSISWVLGTKGSIAFSEALKPSGISTATQCSQGQDSKTNLCVGVINNTSVSIASSLPSSDLKDYFNNLKADVDWVPTK